MQVVLLRILQVEIVIHGAALARHQRVLRGVDGDSIQPGIESAIASKRLQGTVGLHERLLCNVLRLGCIVHVSHDQLQHLVLVSQDQ